MKPAHWRSLMLAVASLLVTLPSQAQKRYDPLNQKEIDDLRETNQEPDKRLKLYIAYARARLVDRKSVV